MISALHLTVFAYCVFECLVAMRNARANVLRLIMFAALGVIHGLVPAVSPREIWWPNASDQTILLAAALTLLGLVSFGAGWRLAELRGTKWDGISPGLTAYLASPAGQRLLKALFWTCAVVAVMAWLGSLIAAAGSIGAALQAGRFEHRFTGNVYLKAMLMHVSHLMSVPCFICMFMGRGYRLLGIVYALMMAAVLFIGSQGARGQALGLIGSVVVAYALRYELTPRRLAVIGVGGLAVGALAIAAYEIRKVMAKSTLTEIGAMVVESSSYENFLARDPLNYHQTFVAAVEHFPRDHDFLNGASYIRLLVFYLPQEYFEAIKPEDTHNTFARVITRNSTLNTIPPTMMGDGYINFWGAPGVPLIMLLNGLLFGWAQRKLRENLLAFLVIGAPFGRLSLLLVRGSPYEVLVLIISSTILLTVLCMVLGAGPGRIGRAIRNWNRRAVALAGGAAAGAAKPSLARAAP